ncbi:MAG: DUF262 domain-containing protein [Acidimicrobiales bacterium]
MPDLEFEEQLASTCSNWTINTFQKYYAEGSLIIRPAFQRNVVWNDEQRSFLIDSVLRGLPIPEIYVQMSTSSDGAEEVKVVDGQQRIVACLRFLADELRLRSDEPLDPRWRNRVFSELDRSLQQRFRSYELLVRKLPNRDDATLREIFRRLNKNVEALLPQELRHAAYTGPFLRFVEKAASSDVLEELGVFTRRDYLRRRSDELVAEIALALVSRAYPNKKEGLDELFLSYEKQGIPEGVLEDLAGRFGRVFEQLSTVAGSLRGTRFRNKSDLYSLFVVLATNAERLPLPADEGAEMLRRLREFSSLVNDIKREEAEGRSIRPLLNLGSGAEALKYLRAVERAASDRMNRVRRDEVLQTVLGSVLAAEPVRELSSDDCSWMEQVDEIADRDDEGDGDETAAEERAHLLDVLVKDNA